MQRDIFIFRVGSDKQRLAVRIDINLYILPRFKRPLVGNRQPAVLHDTQRSLVPVFQRKHAKAVAGIAGRNDIAGVRRQRNLLARLRARRNSQNQKPKKHRKYLSNHTLPAFLYIRRNRARQNFTVSKKMNKQGKRAFQGVFPS